VLDESNMYVRDTSRLVVEARDMGINSLQAMDEQRQDLFAVRNDIQDTDSAVTSARKILTRMAKQALVNKIFLWAVVFLLLLADILFLYYGFIKS